MEPVVLVIMDGWGFREESYGNAVVEAETPFFDAISQDSPLALLNASGLEVGLPEGQMGNSEVGHLNIGAGRIVYQELPRITKAIEDGSFYNNKVILDSIANVKRNNSSLHLIGLLSDGGVHSHINHLFSLIQMAKQNNITNLYIHPLLDGRDTHPRSAEKYISQLQAKLSEYGVGKIGSIMGRYYGMDRDTRWDRIKLAYDTLVYGKGEKGVNPVKIVLDSYSNGINDEFVKPTVVTDEYGKPLTTIKNNDSLFFFNFRADRMRQIVRSFLDKQFNEFERDSYIKRLDVACMTEYDSGFNLPVAFTPNIPKNTLGEIISNNNISQLRTAETEKYAHVTFFFNGGIEKPYNNESRILVPSPKVATYDLQPEMSALTLTNQFIKAVETEKYKFLVINFANPDMVGHTGIYSAAIKAVNTIDSCVGKIANAVMGKKGTVLISADHGNVEEMIDNEGEPITSHTTSPVPFYCLSNKKQKLRKTGRLSDIAPTVLKCLKIDQPQEMTGRSLII